jgi:hypothetical protein
MGANSREREERLDILHARHLPVPSGEENNDRTARRLLARKNLLPTHAAWRKGVGAIESLRRTGERYRTNGGQ